MDVNRVGGFVTVSSKALVPDDSFAVQSNIRAPIDTKLFLYLKP